MKSVSLASGRHLSGTPKPGALDGFARRLVLGQLARLERESLELVDGVAVGAQDAAVGWTPHSMPTLRSVVR